MEGRKSSGVMFGRRHWCGPSPQGAQDLATFWQTGWTRPRAKNDNISFKRKSGQVWRKSEKAGWWEWGDKEPGLNGRIFCN